MSFFLSLPFYGAAFAASVGTTALARLAPTTAIVRRLLLATVNVGMLAWAMAAHPEHLGLLAAWAAVAYGIAAWAERQRGRDAADLVRRLSHLACRLGVLGSILVLATLKYELAQALLLGRPLAEVTWNPTGHGAPLTGILGVSYLTLRIIQVLIDAPKGRLGRLEPLTFISFVFFFPTFVAGPIDRYQRFAKDVATPLPVDWQVAGGALLRIALGLSKKLVLATLCAEFSFVNMDIGELTGRGPASAIGTMYAYGLYIYFDFSGYTDMAVGVGRLLGIAVPENFQRPFFARNIQDFWNRWHISLSTWLRDYLYYPLSMGLMRLTRQKSGALVPAFALFLTFVIMGVWHGDDVACLLYGIWHGAALGGFKLLEQWMKRRKPELAKRLAASRVWHVVAVLLTLHVYFLGLLIFAGDFNKLIKVATAFASRGGG